jgi:Sulfatase
VQEVRHANEDERPSRERERRKRQFVVHPLLFAAFPVLYLYAHNVREGVSTGDVVRAVAIVVAGTAALFGLAMVFIRDWRRAGLAVSALVLLFFSYGHVYDALRGTRVAGVVVGRHKVLGSLWILLGIVLVALALRARKRLVEATTILNVVAAGLVLINVFSVFQYQARSRATERAAIQESAAGFQGRLPDPSEIRNRPAGVGGRPSRPDIYYIMLEEYGGQAGLQKVFGFDNSSFLRALEQRGLYVAHQSTANYPRTSYSLASSLNMEYLDFLTDKLGRDSTGAEPLSRLIKYNRVGEYLKSIGYQYTQIGSWWEPTRLSPIADQNVVYGGLSEFDRVLYETTALRPVGHEQFRRREWKRVQFAFNAVEHTRPLNGPKFVFAHILVPHSPYVFHPDGRYKTPEEVGDESRNENYLDQVRYANARVLRMLDVLQSGPESSRPVVVLQSDEGPFEGAPTAWGTISPNNLVRKFPILNAYYLPGVTPNRLTQLTTPVNSFRVVFGLYFGADLANLPDRNYVFRAMNHAFDFTDVTQRVRDLMAG